MIEKGFKSKNTNLNALGLDNVSVINWNLSVKELIAKTIERKEGSITSTGALAVDTGEFTGRSPKDKFIVKDAYTENTVWWGDVNIPFESSKYDALFNKMKSYLANKEVFARDCYACADPKYKINVRVVTETPWANLFANNLFLRPSNTDIESFVPEWNILCIPSFKADPKTDGTRQHNFAVINFSKKTILIGGTAYTGEIKKGIFTILNYLLPQEKGVLSMHCSANIGQQKDTAIFFGLSGTGKTTLSADPYRGLIGDDEHGWADNTVFNFEGGCYAKCVNLTREKEPQIFDAIKEGALVENIVFKKGGNEVDYDNISKTENTRAAYPINHISNAVEPSVGTTPKNIFFLTCDAYGVLPPISKLTAGQAMYHFISGYTAKVAGTEVGITEPTLTFSACFGKAFLPLHPTKYADLLGKKLKENKVNVWLVNTGWTGGPYGVGNRIKLSYTRALITEALNGNLEKQTFENLPIFNLAIPTKCEGVPAEILNPKKTWIDKDAYDTKANSLASAFVKNFEQYASNANQEILEAAPKSVVNI